MAVQTLPKVNLDVIPQIRQAINQIETIYERYGYPLVITSARDSQHSVGSLHYVGAAIDFKSKGLPSSIKQSIYSDLKSAFGSPTWWVDLEFLGGIQEHFHLGYNPARQRAEIDPFGFENVITSYVPTTQSEDSGYIPDSDNYEAHPAGTIRPEYFTPSPTEPDWKLYVLVAVGFYLFLEVLDS